MNRKEKLHIAKEAYKAIKSVVDSVESYADCIVSCDWDECITVDDELFHGPELKEKYDQGN